MEEENKMETEVPKEETEEDTMITVNVKTPKEKKAIKINDKASINARIVSTRFKMCIQHPESALLMAYSVLKVTRKS